MWLEKLKALIKEKGGKDKVFKADYLNKNRLGILFKEQWQARYSDSQIHINIPPIYTLEKDSEYKGCLPLKKLYLEIADPTEYEFANICFYDYDHFKSLMRTAYFKKFIDDCRDELELKLRSDAVMKIKDEALNGKGATAITASKFLIERGWIGSKKEKEAILRRKKHDLEINETIESDLKLIEAKVTTQL